MPKHPTTIRLDRTLYKNTMRKAKKEGMSFSWVVHMLLYAFTEGTVELGVTRYPKKYLEEIGKEADQLRRQIRRGKAKQYSSSKELFDDILGR